jgi:putative Mn2+ efflux pump MntP
MAILAAVVLGLGLAMDAVAVALVSGLAKRTPTRREAWLMAGTFGLFQAVMPVLGALIGVAAAGWIERFDHWLAFWLLGIIGAKMLWEGWHFHPDEERSDPFGMRRLLLKGLATSVDALAAGFTLPLIALPIWVSALIIGAVTTAACLPAVWLGSRLGVRWAAWAEIIGGVVLIGLGTRILVSHLWAI